MKKIIADRGLGKTEQLIERAHAIDAIIVVPTRVQCHEIKARLKEKEYNNKVVTARDYVNTVHFGLDNPVVIDDVDAILYDIFYGANIDTITMSI